MQIQDGDTLKDEDAEDKILEPIFILGKVISLTLMGQICRADDSPQFLQNTTGN